MQVAIIGSGYVGLVSGSCLAELGHHVTCIDRDRERVACLRRGEMPIYEAGLEALVARNVDAGRLRFDTELAPAVAAADVVFIAVGTPPRQNDGHADLSAVWGVARAVASALRGRTIVVTKSTVPVGTGDRIEAIIREMRPDAELAVVSNPEFLREGSAVGDFLEPDRIVVGAAEAWARIAMAALYAPLTRQGAQYFVTDRRNAELLKYAANAFLAMKISFINEMADLCERAGADVGEVARGMGMDARIGASFLQAGPGYGGSCFPKDTLALARTAHDHGLSLRLVEAVIAVNDARRPAMARKVLEACGGSVRGRLVAVLGLTFKPGTDDVRESPAIAIVEALQRAGAQVRAHDPAGMDQAVAHLHDVEFATSAEACIDGADVAVLVTDWEEYRRLSHGHLRRLLRTPVVVDLRNGFDAAEMARSGIRHLRIGAAELAPAAGHPGNPERPAAPTLGGGAARPAADIAAAPEL